MPHGSSIHSWAKQLRKTPESTSIGEEATSGPDRTEKQKGEENYLSDRPTDRKDKQKNRHLTGMKKKPSLD